MTRFSRSYIAVALLLHTATQLPAQGVTMATCGSDMVQLHTPSGSLVGTLRCPSTPAPWPVVLLIAGSGPTDRDGNSPLLPGKNNSLLMLADGLAAKGIASLRYDKRGIAESRAAMVSEADLRFDTYADDAADWVRQLRADARFTSITIAGHSEGSLLGMLATRSGKADAFVSLEGAGRPIGVVLHEQLEARAPTLVADADRIMKELKSGKTVDSVPAPLISMFRPSVQPYLISWLRYDPATELTRLQVPVLIVQGTTDIQVSLDDANRLSKARADATMLIVEGMNHILKLVSSDATAQTQSYSDPTLPVAPQVIAAIATFVEGVRHK
jgi:fermentation-respiration switch protein FrsA (DUF1100 family)